MSDGLLTISNARGIETCQERSRAGLSLLSGIVKAQHITSPGQKATKFTLLGRLAGIDIGNEQLGLDL